MPASRFRLAPVLLFSTLLAIPSAAQAQGVIETLVGTVIPGLAQRILGAVKRSASGEDKAKENKAVDSLVRNETRSALARFSVEVVNIQRLEDAADVGHRAKAEVWALNSLVSDQIYEHIDKYDTLAVSDLAARITDHYASLKQVLTGAKFSTLTNDGVSDYLLDDLKPLKRNIDTGLDAIDRALSGYPQRDIPADKARSILRSLHSIQSILWPLMNDLETLSGKLASHIDIYGRELNNALKALATT